MVFIYKGRPTNYKGDEHDLKPGLPPFIFMVDLTGMLN